MNKNIQSHIGSILVALAGIGTELLGKTSADAPEAEPTTDKPKGGRPKKEHVTTAPVETPASSSAPVEEKKPEQSTVTGAMSIEELKALILPFVTGDESKGIKPNGPEVKKITDKHLPSDRQGQGIKALVEFPEKHASFKRDIEALAY